MFLLFLPFDFSRFLGGKRIIIQFVTDLVNEGAEDFYLYQTFWNLAMEKQDSGGKQAMALLENVVAELELNQRRPPERLSMDELKVKIVEAMQTLTREASE